MTSFYIDLLSNASLDIYPNNTLAFFSNFMSNPINLGRGSEWEVALTDISFPNRVYNVTDGEFTLGYIPTPTLQRYRVVVNKPDTVSKELINSYPDVPFLNQYRSFNIPKGCYTEIGQFIDAMNSQIATFTNMERTMTFAYNEETLNLSFTFEGTTEGQSRVYFKIQSDDLAQILGLGTDAVYCEANQIIAPYPCDIARFHTIFVYSDIVDFSNVRNVKNQLLRAFTFRQRTKNEDLIVIYPCDNRFFSNLQYRNVCLDNFNSIQIEIRDMKGKLIPFTSLGLVVLNLHFREKHVPAITD